MRKFIYLLPLAFVLGCGSVATTAYKAEGVIITSVDGAMHGWADFANNPANKVTQVQIDQVHKAYGQYVLVQDVVKAALEKYLASKTPDDAQAVTTANAALSVAKNSLIDLVVSLLHQN